MKTLSNTTNTLSKVTLAAAAVLSLNALAITGQPNGGDICADRIEAIGQDINSWINRGGHIEGEGLDLPAGVSHADYAVRMKDAINSARVSCVSHTLYMDPENKRGEKTCINGVAADGIPEIKCTISKFLGERNRYGEFEGGLSEEAQYRLAHHEYAGITRLEANRLLADGTLEQKSNFAISNQISAYLEEVTIKKLAVKASQSPQFLEGYVQSFEDFKAEHGDSQTIGSSYIERVMQDLVGELNDSLFKETLDALDDNLPENSSPYTHHLIEKTAAQVVNLHSVSNGTRYWSKKHDVGIYSVTVPIHQAEIVIESWRRSAHTIVFQIRLDPSTGAYRLKTDFQLVENDFSDF